MDGNLDTPDLLQDIGANQVDANRQKSFSEDESRPAQGGATAAGAAPRGGEARPQDVGAGHRGESLDLTGQTNEQAAEQYTRQHDAERTKV